MRAAQILRLAAQQPSEPPAMAAVRVALKAAMKSGHAVEKNTLRAIMSTVKNSNIAKPGSVVNDIAFSGILAGLAKKRLEAASEYLKGNRKDLAENEQAEHAVIEKVLATLNLSKPEELQKKIKEFMDTQSDKTFKSIMSNLPKNVEEVWRSPKSSIVEAIRKQIGQRSFSTMAGRAYSHENPLGLRRRSQAQSQPRGPRQIPNVSKVLLVSSAKGGVGKSTVSVSLAAALSKRGLKVGVLDVDIFGPSLPHMLGLSAASEPALTVDGKLKALQSYGLKAMSMGFLIPKDKSVSWRGLLVQKALQQLLFEVEWGPSPLDILVVDMPPGTGDVQLTVAQQVKVDGAVIVTTPQDISLIDVKRGLDMFRTVKIPVLGMVQNMSVFVCPHCHGTTEIFGASKTIEGVPVLGKIPLLPDIASSGDSGTPHAIVNDAQYYEEIAANVMAKLNSDAKPN